MLKSFAAAGIVAISLFSAACSSTSSPMGPSALTSAPAAADDSASARSGQPTIVGLASANPNFSTLVYALGQAGLVAEFDGRPNYTVFAPTDAAFEAAARAFGQADGRALVDYLKANNLLATVLAYHVTQGSRNATGVVSSGQVKMLDGNDALVTSDGDSVKIENATITATDIRASNGYIHVIDAVMLPPSLR